MGTLGFIDFNAAAGTVEDIVSRVKVAGDKAENLANANKISKSHWNKLSKAEQNFKESLDLLNVLYPKKQRTFDVYSNQIGIIALLAVGALLSSASFLYVLMNRKTTIN